jgi:nucleotide-binding universal stress UspA family protein
MKTAKMNKVLIALDYDPTAQKVAETGFSMAKGMNAEVILLHVITDPVYYSTPEYSAVLGFSGYIDVSQLQLDSVDGLIRASQSYLDKIKHHLGDMKITTVVKEGDFADSILAAAKELNADIIVLGTHSRRWLEEILMGSVTEKVLHHSTIPLFIVPTKNHSI